MAALVGDTVQLEVLAQRVAKFGTAAQKVALVKVLGEEYRDFMSECFRDGRSPYGEKWLALKFRSSKGGAGQKPLLDTGLMRAACTYRDVTPSGFRVAVGLIYATTHQYADQIGRASCRERV